MGPVPKAGSSREEASAWNEGAAHLVTLAGCCGGAELANPPVTPELVQRHLERVLVSPALARSKKLCHFLRFTVQEAMRGRAEELKEYSIGVAVFNRGREFDPGADPIVRVQARRLRAKLQEFYRTEGKDEPVLIDYPVGSYAPVFRGRIPPAVKAARTLVPGVRPADPDADRPIAVVPFAHVGAAELEGFGDGLTDELIHAISVSGSLRVVSRTSSFQFKSSGEDVRRFGERLGARAIVEGSVRVEGNRVRAQVQLIDTASGVSLWSAVFEQPLDGVFTTQEELARKMAAALQFQLSGNVHYGRVVEPATMPEARTLYLKGRHLLKKGSEPAVTRAIHCFEEALAVDSHLAPASAGLAEAHLASGLQGIVAPDAAMPKAKALALDALRADAGSPEARITLASVLAVYDWDFPAAARQFRAILESRPGHAAAHHAHALATILPFGRIEDSLLALKLALELDPLSPAIRADLAWLLLLGGRPDEAVAECHKALELEPEFPRAWRILGRVHESQEKWDEAATAYRDAAKATGGGAGRVLLETATARLQAVAGNIRQVLEALKTLKDLAVTQYVPALDIAAIHAGMGKAAPAFLWLERALAARDAGLIWLAVNPDFAGLREDPRYEGALRQLHLH